MADILKKIISQTYKDLNDRKTATSLADLRSMPLYNRAPFSLKESLIKGSGIIAEHKRQSPSKGSFNCLASLSSVVTGYEKAGASAISCLTDLPFFGGTLDDLVKARERVNIPVLRKDFMMESYQIHESKAHGADAILLIAACLNDQQLKAMALESVALGLSILFEVHDRLELERVKEIIVTLPQNSFVIGINNRDLTKFKTDIQNSIDLLPHFPDGVVAISESGISDPSVVKKLQDAGYTGFLIGEHFMKTNDPGSSCEQFIKELQHAD
jgi:indole-3-glycerol phosphate synthase